MSPYKALSPGERRLMSISGGSAAQRRKRLRLYVAATGVGGIPNRILTALSRRVPVAQAAELHAALTGQPPTPTQRREMECMRAVFEYIAMAQRLGADLRTGRFFLEGGGGGLLFRPPHLFLRLRYLERRYAVQYIFQGK